MSLYSQQILIKKLFHYRVSSSSFHFKQLTIYDIKKECGIFVENSAYQLLMNIL